MDSRTGGGLKAMVESGGWGPYTSPLSSGHVERAGIQGTSSSDSFCVTRCRGLGTSDLGRLGKWVIPKHGSARAVVRLRTFMPSERHRSSF